jgi:hypothetical protein
VRQQLSDHRDYVEGLIFVGSRLTSDKGPGPFDTLRSA